MDSDRLEKVKMMKKNKLTKEQQKRLEEVKKSLTEIVLKSFEDAIKNMANKDNEEKKG